MPCIACKIILDCNGEVREAANDVPTMAAHGLLSDEAMLEFIDIREAFVKDYLKWKKGLPD